MKTNLQPVASLPSHWLSRRRFAKTLAASATGWLAAPALLRGQNLNSRLNVAVIGVGGRGAGNLAESNG